MLKQSLIVKTIDAGIDFRDFPLFFRTVFEFDDLFNLPFGITDNSAVLFRIVQHCGQNDHAALIQGVQHSLIS